MTDVDGTAEGFGEQATLPYSLVASRQELLFAEDIARAPERNAREIARRPVRTYVIVLTTPGSAKLVDGYASSEGLVIQIRAEDPSEQVPTGFFPPGTSTLGLAELLAVANQSQESACQVENASLLPFSDPHELVVAAGAGEILDLEHVVVISWTESEMTTTFAQALIGGETQWSFENGSQVAFRSGDLISMAAAIVAAGTLPSGLE